MGQAKERIKEHFSLRISDNAIQNIDDITRYIAFIKHQPLNAIRVGDKIYQTISNIENNPLAFRECEEIPTKHKIYRKAVCMSWVIIYKIKANEIVILGIIHASRNNSSIKGLRKIK